MTKRKEIGDKWNNKTQEIILTEDINELNHIELKLLKTNNT